MKILLTGSAGFIGRHMRRAFTDDDVTRIDLADGLDCLDFFRTDMTRYDLAVHCAATVGGRATIDGSPLAVATNLALDSWYFRWLIRSRTHRAVYFSSSAAYPVDLQEQPRTLAEDDLNPRAPRCPDATYGLAKVTGERLACEALAEGVDVLIPRPFSGYGQDQALDYPFPAFMHRAAVRADPFDVWGDGEQVRDFIHVRDIVGGVLTLLDAGVVGPVNLGTGRATSFNQLAGLAAETAGYTPMLRHHRDAPTGVRYRVADVSRLVEFYLPTVTLEEGVRRAMDLAAA